MLVFMMTNANRTARPEALRAITAEVARLGHAGPESARAFCSSGISMAAYQAAVAAGLELAGVA